jgi:protein SCO1
VNPRVVLALSLVCVFALGAVVLAAGDSGGGESLGRGFQGAALPRGLKAPDFSLTDERGHSVSMREFRGRPVVVTFLYTTCDQTCPAQALTVKGALDDLGHDLPALAIAVDPRRDTAERARAFLAKQQVLGRVRFVLGTRDQLRPLWGAYGVRPERKGLEHTGRFVLVDRRGMQRIGYPIDQATPERLAHDLNLLERGS